MADITTRLAEAVGQEHVRSGAEAPADWARDESLTGTASVPAHVVRPGTAEEVASVLRAATDLRIPVTARGAGTGLCGSAVPRPDGVLVSFERMAAVLEIDADVHTVRAALHWAEVGIEANASGGCRVRIEGSSNEALLRVVTWLASRHPVRVVEPESVATLVDQLKSRLA